MIRGAVFSIVLGATTGKFLIEPYPVPTVTHECFQAINKGNVTKNAKYTIMRRGGELVALANGEMTPDVWYVLCADVGVNPDVYFGEVLVDGVYAAHIEKEHNLDIYFHVLMDRANMQTRIRYTDQRSENSTLRYTHFNLTDDSVLAVNEINIPARTGGVQTAFKLSDKFDNQIKVEHKCGSRSYVLGLNHYATKKYSFIRMSEPAQHNSDRKKQPVQLISQDEEEHGIGSMVQVPLSAALDAEAEERM